MQRHFIRYNDFKPSYEYYLIIRICFGNNPGREKSRVCAAKPSESIEQQVCRTPGQRSLRIQATPLFACDSKFTCVACRTSL